MVWEVPGGVDQHPQHVIQPLPGSFPLSPALASVPASGTLTPALAASGGGSRKGCEAEGTV